MIDFAERRGLDPQETYEKIMSNYGKLMMQIHVKPTKTNYERDREVEDTHGLDFRDKWMKKSSYDY